MQPKEALREICKFIAINPDMGLDKSGKNYRKNWTMVRYDWVNLPVVNKINQIYMAALGCLDKTQALTIYRADIAKVCR